MDQQQISISTGTILKIITILLGVVLLWVIRDVLILLLVVFVIVAGLNPLVELLNNWLPRLLAVIIVFLLILSVWVAIGFLLAPLLIDQVNLLLISLPDLINRWLPGLVNDNIIKELTSSPQDLIRQLSGGLTNIGWNIYETTVGFLTGFATLITVVVLSFYLLLEKAAIRHLVTTFIPEKSQKIILATAEKISKKMGAWLLGQIGLCLTVGILNLIGILIFGLPYALALAAWTAVTEVIPYIGPWLGAIPVLLVAFSLSPITGLLMLCWIIAVQQTESTFLVPKIMGRALGLSPVIVILAILIGYKLLGILGVLLALPIAAGVVILAREYPQLKASFRE